MRLERLTHVHNGDAGTIGQLISETRGVLRFGGEGSGLIDLDKPAAPSALGFGGASGEFTLRIASVTFSALPDDVQAELGGDEIPCILGHSGLKTTIILTTRSLARVTGGLSDLRGKIRFGVARVGWEL